MTKAVFCIVKKHRAGRTYRQQPEDRWFFKQRYFSIVSRQRKVPVISPMKSTPKRLKALLLEVQWG
jgi:hypothetical protein